MAKVCKYNQSPAQIMNGNNLVVNKRRLEEYKEFIVGEIFNDEKVAAAYQDYVSNLTFQERMRKRFNELVAQDVFNNSTALAELQVFLSTLRAFNRSSIAKSSEKYVKEFTNHPCYTQLDSFNKAIEDVNQGRLTQLLLGDRLLFHLR